MYLIVRQTLDSSNLKVFAEDRFITHENGRKFSKRVENTVRKREIAPNDEFLLFPQCFQNKDEILIKLEEIFIKFFKYCYFNQLMFCNRPQVPG